MQTYDNSKVVIVGAGFVGSSAAYATMIQGICSELVLIDVNKEKALGEAMDLTHGLSFVDPICVHAGDYDDCKDADVVVITAGLAQKPGQTRLDLAVANAKIVGGIVEEIIKRTKEAVILVVSNPVDVMTYVAIQKAGYPAGQVFGSGTALDSSRFRFLLSEMFGVSPRSVHASILGEHGDSELMCLSHANIAGEPLTNMPGYNAKKVEEIYSKTKNAAYEIIQKKGATYYAIGLGIADIVRAVLYNEKLVMPLSVLLQGEYDLHDVCISVPALVGSGGVQKIVPIQLASDELEKLQASATQLKTVIASLGK
ncbi:L-lactate dehydrogenase [Candidatus Uhrbacteria bacterium]|nr:L-lactate dehydrogenase [Candidatus Uhrbacteria bacterium]